MKSISMWRRTIKIFSKVLLPASQKTVIHTRINNYSLLVLANEDVGRAIHFGRNYEHLETEYLMKVITPDAVCIDIGANVGYFSMLFAKIAYKGKVYAFDPVPLNIALLHASNELNGFENIEIIASAVGASNGETILSQSTDSAYSSIRDTGRKAVERTIRVPMTTLDTFIKNRAIHAVDMLKLDVEGAEGLVIEGAKALLGDPSRSPRIVLMELFDDNLRSYDTSAMAIIDTMRSFGYTPFFIGNAAEPTEFRIDELEKFYNVLFLGPRSTSND